MDFTQMTSFVTVIECGSFSCAAKKLHMAHSTVTGHIQRLEQELDCTLIRRSTRTMVVTDKGQLVYRFAKQVLGSKAELDRELNRLDCSHRISIASTSCIGFGLIPDILAKYRRRRNDITFSLTHGQDKEILTMLCSGAISLGFVRKPCQHGDVDCILLGQSPYKLLLPRGGAFSDLQIHSADPADLTVDYPIVLATKGDDSRNRIEGRWWERFGTDRPMPAPAVEACGVENIINYVRSGLGFALLPNFVARRTEGDHRTRIMEIEKETLNPATVYLICRKGETNQAVLDFIQFIRNWAYGNRNRDDMAYYE